VSADVEHLTCQEFVEVLTDYLEDALEPAERADIERHIVICRGCSNYIEQMRRTIDLVGRAADDGMEAAPTERLLGLFREWQAGRASA
jgi:anti-sigma factor RsiW